MKRGVIMTLAVAATLTLVVGCTAEEKKPVSLETQAQKVSYSIGVNIGSDFKAREIEIDADLMAAGIREALAGTARMSEEEVRETLTAFQQEVMAQEQARAKKAADDNLSTGEAFLSENAKKEGVVTLESGLQYRVLEPGSGATPTKESTVTVHYRGTLVDGTEFDSSYGRGEPATFPVGGVIAGWTEALQLMKEGAKWQLFIPASLAYGERGAGPVIGPNATLIFDVELLEIK